MVFPDDETTLLDTSNLLNRKLANLPVTGVKDGAMAWAADGRKSGESAGAGTGSICYFNAADSSWRNFYDDGIVVI